MLSSTYRLLLYNLWYLFRKPPWDTQISPPELLSYIDSHPPGRALDLGCGTGTNVLALAQAGWQVCGVDFAPKAVALARRRLSRAMVKADLRVGDVTRINDIHGSFDLVLDIGCFHSLTPDGKKRYAGNLGHLLVPGGTFLLYGFTGGDSSANIGLSAADIKLLGESLKLTLRVDGLDGNQRASAWFTFTKP